MQLQTKQMLISQKGKKDNLNKINICQQHTSRTRNATQTSGMFTSGGAKQNQKIWCCELQKIKWSSKVEGNLIKKTTKQLKTCPSTVQDCTLVCIVQLAVTGISYLQFLYKIQRKKYVENMQTEVNKCQGLFHRIHIKITVAGSF